MFEYQTTIEDRAYQQIDVAEGYPIAFDNVPFIVPEEQTWIKCEIYDGVVSRASLGTTYMERSGGTVFFTIYTPKSIGSGDTRIAADAVKDAFCQQQVTTANGVLTFYDATIKRLGEVYASGAGSSISSTVASVQWYAIVVGIGFKFDEIV